MPNKPNTSKEEPIRIYIYDFLSDKYAPSHAALEYKGETIDFSSHGFSSSSNETMHGCKVYEVYPSKIGVSPAKLQQAIKNRKAQIKGSDYQYLTQNCADQVVAVLRSAGAKDLPNIGIPSMSGKAPQIAADALLGPVLKDVLEKSTVEKWAETHGKLTEVRKNETDYYKTKNDFLTYLKILENPETYKKELKEERDRQLRGESGNFLTAIGDNEDILKKYKDTLPPEQYEAYKKQYEALSKKQLPSAAEQAKIKAEYAKKLALANRPREEIYQKALLSLANVSVSSDKLLYSQMYDACTQYPNTLREFKKDMAKYDFYMAKNGIFDKKIMDTPTKTKPLPNQYLRKAALSDTHTT